MTAVSPLSPRCWHLPSPGGSADFPLDCTPPPPLVSGDQYDDTAYVRGGVQSKGKSADPPGLGRCQQRGDNG